MIKLKKQEELERELNFLRKMLEDFAGGQSHLFDYISGYEKLLKEIPDALSFLILGFQNELDELRDRIPGYYISKQFEELQKVLETLYYGKGEISWRGHDLRLPNAKREDWLGICLRNDYKPLFDSLGIDSVVLNLTGTEQEIAQQVGRYAKSSGKKPFVADFAHYVMAYCVPDDATAIYFDNHADDGIDHKPQQAFSSGTFQAFAPRNQHIVLGATAKQYGHRAKVFPPDKIRDVLSETLESKLFISLDLDVFDPEYYTVIYTHGVLSPREVRNLTKELVRERRVVGLNVAGYAPYITGEVIKEVTAFLLDYRS